ncbi:MAG: cell division protein FtsZ [Tenuifilum sp.]|uniref:cell division protein FtsZ n=1 Tax=Tenuifilum sp. TaxID=2760880 RepID=UPI0024AA66AC|nr:cell division protein FtsZ [Tenuifilum sp.]MDI3526181.1 cell division protein FtsZ [Tenuifilum sp.]
MGEDIINFDLPVVNESIIKVIGVGGGGGNAVNYMHNMGIKDVDFVLCNTDAQALINSPVEMKIQLGATLTEGRGAGNKPEIGKQAAIESLSQIVDLLQKNTKMVFITAGMGGGTGTGAAPIIAKAAKELGILTVAIVTIPFRTEGRKRMTQAIEGIKNISQFVDSLLVINNEKLLEVYGNLKLTEAFAKADDVLATAAKGIAEIITVHGYINVDFADVETVMYNSGVALMGSGRANGDNRALEAVKEALESPLLNNNDISGARNILLNITYGQDEITMEEVGVIIDYVQHAAGDDADLIWGNGCDPSLGEDLKVTVIATGFGTSSIPELYVKQRNIEVISLTTDKQTTKVQQVSDFPEPTKPPQDKPRSSKKGTPIDPAQRVIEFDIDSDIFEVKTVNTNHVNQQNPEPTKPKPAPKPANAQPTPFTGNGSNRWANIDELENVPAYKRRNVNIEPTEVPKSTPISRISLTDDDDIVINPENPYLYDNVD